MEITPIDIQQQKFKIRFRGFDIREVDSFLETVAEAYEKIFRENEEIKENLKQLEKEVDGHKAQENAFRQVMIKSQKMMEQMEESAKKNADQIIKDAEKKADQIRRDADKEADATISQAQKAVTKMDNDAYARMNKIEEEISTLKRQKTQAEVEIRTLLESHLRLLDMGNEDMPDSKDRNYKNNIMLLKKTN